jgi:hypothetical protein
MRENEATLGRLQQQGAGMPSEERERERERERWSLLRAARDEADRSLSLAASLADKEAALSHAHATIKEVRLSKFVPSIIDASRFNGYQTEIYQTGSANGLFGEKIVPSPDQ